MNVSNHTRGMRNNYHKCHNNCLWKYRKARGLKQKDVAEVLGLKSTGMISRWEKGVCLPDTLNLLKLSVLYRTLVDALFIELVRILREELLSREEEVLKTRNDVNTRTKD